MQQRHIDRNLYFNELAATSREFYPDYIKEFSNDNLPKRVLEIGCGEGGNLLPFAESGSFVEGMDLNEEKIKFGNSIFEQRQLNGRLYHQDFMKFDLPKSDTEKFDLILIHDVIEHIEKEFKREFVARIKEFASDNCLIFFAFPAWQMPFGGHQQICQSFISKIPYIHLLPTNLYKAVLKLGKENDATIEELLSIKRSKMPIEKFERLYQSCGFRKENRRLWFINPHYKQKFNLKPRRLNKLIERLPVIRNFFTTSCWYLLK